MFNGIRNVVFLATFSHFIAYLNNLFTIGIIDDSDLKTQPGVKLIKSSIYDVQLNEQATIIKNLSYEFYTYYNEEGLLLSQKRIYQDHTEEMHFVFAEFYGNNIWLITLPDKELLYEYNYQFDSSGKVKEIQIKNKEGQKIYIYQYQYDNKNRIKEISCNSNEKQIFSYNKKKKLQKIEFFASKNKFQASVYDYKNDQVSVMVFMGVDNQWLNRCEYNYNEKGLVLQQTWYLNLKNNKQIINRIVEFEYDYY